MATNVTVGKHLEEFIKNMVDSGRYATPSEVMRDGLFLLEEREQRRAAKLEALKAAIQEGLDSEPAGEFNAEAIIQRGTERLKAQKHGQ
jgi:antitoxin ParD1/3/4